MSNIQKLKSNFKKLRNDIPQNIQIYYHVESINNFILHLDEIRNDKTKIRICENLLSCIDFIHTRMRDNENLRDCYKEIFSKHIYYLGNIYRDELGFIKKPYYPLTVLIFIILFILIYFMAGLTQSLLFVSATAIIFIVYNYRKIIKKKYY